MRPDVEKHELRSAGVFDNSSAVSSGYNMVPINVDRHFGDEVRLVLFLDASRVAGIVYQRCKCEESIGKVYAAGVAPLSCCRLSAKEDRTWKDLSQVCRMQNLVFLTGGSLTESSRSGRDKSKHEEKKRNADARDSFHSLRILHEFCRKYK